MVNSLRRKRKKNQIANFCSGHKVYKGAPHLRVTNKNNVNINSSNDLIQTLLLLLCTWRHMYQKKMANAESWMHKKLFEIYQCRYKCHMQYLPSP